MWRSTAVYVRQKDKDILPETVYYQQSLREYLPFVPVSGETELMKQRIVLPTAAEWQFEFKDLIRGMSGGFLFGIPLLYTIEAWWVGSAVKPGRMLLCLGIAFVVVFLLNRTDGFRQVRPDGFWQAATDSVEAIAISTLCAGFILFLLRQITLKTSLEESLGKLVIECIPFAIGVALARSILQEGQSDLDAAPDAAAPSDQLPTPFNSTVADIGATLVGALIIGFNIAPTEEIAKLEAIMTIPWLLALLATSLVVTYLIVFAAGFTAEQKRRTQSGTFQNPLTETVVSYLVSLLTSVLMLSFFQTVDFQDPWTLWLKDAVILGLPTAIGGAAGRLAI